MEVIMEDLKQIISSYLKIDAKKIQSTTFIDKTTIPGSIMIHRMYSELKQNGYEVMHPSNIRTFGDLEKTLSGESNQSVIDPSEKYITPLQIEIENGSNYGNAAAVFTQSGGLAKQVMDRASAGMIGVNIGVPVPREPFSFGGWNESKFGVGDITGRSSIEFWTQNKKTTTKWNPEAQTNWMS